MKECYDDLNMPVTIIHGEDIITSRSFLKKMLDAQKAPILDAKTTDSGTILQELASISLFEDDQPLVIEHLFSPKRTSVIPALMQSTRTIYLWEPKQIGSALLVKAAGARVVHFPISRTLFTWLDSLRPSAFPKMVGDLHSLLTHREPPELIWRILMNRLQELTQVHSQRVASVPQWKIQKLQTQAQKFSNKALSRVYVRAIETEYAFKSGKSPLSIACQIELVLAAIDRCQQAGYAKHNANH